MRHGLAMAPAGLVLVLALVAAGPEKPATEVTVLDERFGSRTAPILLIARPDVQIELQLDSQQVSSARNTIARLLERGLSLKGKTGPAVEVERRRIDEDSIRWLSDTLSEKQIERLYQVNFQWEGAAAMTRPHVITRLKLTGEQRVAIDQVLKQLETTRRARGPLTPAEIGNFSSQAFAVLSPSQRATWNVLLGPPCHFTIGGRAGTPGKPADYQSVKAQAPSGG